MSWTFTSLLLREKVAPHLPPVGQQAKARGLFVSFSGFRW